MCACARSSEQKDCLSCYLKRNVLHQSTVSIFPPELSEAVEEAPLQLAQLVHCFNMDFRALTTHTNTHPPVCVCVEERVPDYNNGTLDLDPLRHESTGF